MRQYITSLFIGLSILTACTEDHSKLADENNFINISGIEKDYQATAFSGEVLSIKPTIESSFNTNDLSYLWTYFNTSESGHEKIDKKGRSYYIQPDTLSHEKDLQYPVTLSDGSYTLILTVSSKSTGFFQQYVTSLQTASALSYGFYILKETADGNTDIDLFRHVNNTMITDVIASRQGKPLAGKPRAMDINHQLAYLDPETDVQKGANFLCITTENNQAYWIRALDTKTIKTLDNVHYEKIANEVPYRVVRGFFTEFLLTNQGIFYGHTVSQKGTGILGETTGKGASKFVVQASGNQAFNLIYWALPTKDLIMVDYNGGSVPVESKVENYPAQGLTNYECLYAGLNMTLKLKEKAYFVFEDQTNHQKLLYTIAAGWDNSVLEKVQVINADSHFAKASLRAICGQSAIIAYAVDNNKVYSMKLNETLDEKELIFEGLPQNEQITFISNRYFLDNTRPFDYLIVGTQTGDTYKLYFYNLVGGEPVGKPVYTTSGKGKLKSLGYIDPTVSDMSDGAIAPVLND